MRLLPAIYGGRTRQKVPERDLSHGGARKGWFVLLIDDMREALGEFAFEGGGFSGDGVRESELIGVQAEAPGGVGRGAVFFVAGDGVLDVGQLHADLILSSGDWRHIQQGIFFIRPYDLVLSDGILRMLALLRGIDLQDRVLRQMAF